MKFTARSLAHRMSLAVSVSAFALGAMLVVQAAVPAQAQASTCKQLSMKYNAQGVRYVTTSYKVDLDAKAGADSVKFVPTRGRAKNGASGVRVYISGKKALTLKSKHKSARYTFYYLGLTKKRKYLAVGQPTKDPYSVGKMTLYSYKGGKLVEQADLTQKWGVLGKPTMITGVSKAKSKSFKVTYHFSKQTLGDREYQLTYSLDTKTNTWSISTKAASPLYATGKWTSTVKAKLYESAAPKQSVDADGNKTVNNVVATMKKGAKVTQVKVHRDGYIHVKLSNGKSGWFSWKSYKKGKPFKGVRGY